MLDIKLWMATRTLHRATRKLDAWATERYYTNKLNYILQGKFPYLGGWLTRSES